MPAYRSSRCDLNTCTLLRAIMARRTRRMSSSLLPLNITPHTTSIQPDSGLVKKPSGLTGLRLRLSAAEGVNAVVHHLAVAARRGIHRGRRPREADVPRACPRHGAPRLHGRAFPSM